MKYVRILALTGALCMALAGCGGSSGGVYVQSVEKLAAMGGIAPGDRFLGLVVSEHVAEITRDEEKTIEELLVKEGDDVKQGQPLFSYDTEELQLNLDKSQLELDQLISSIESYEDKIKTLERERATVSGTAKLQYTVEIQSAQIDLKEAQLKKKTQEEAVRRAEELLNNSTVTSPIAGRVQKISEDGSTDASGKPAAYITIQKSGSYRVKGVLGELQRGGLKEGDRVRMVSRTDEDQCWTGKVTLVDYDSATQGNANDRYSGGSTDEMTASSRYPFYVALDSTDGLMLGQHLYIELDSGLDDSPGIGISAAFVCYNEDGSAYLWAERGGKLEKRAVTLGEYDSLTDVQKITEGLTLEDYIAYPDPDACRPGAATTRTMPAAEPDTEKGDAGELPGGDMGELAGEEGALGADDLGEFADMGELGDLGEGGAD